jgi:hypothetical protein
VAQRHRVGYLLYHADNQVCKIWNPIQTSNWMCSRGFCNGAEGCVQHKSQRRRVHFSDKPRRHSCSKRLSINVYRNIRGAFQEQSVIAIARSLVPSLTRLILGACISWAESIDCPPQHSRGIVQQAILRRVSGQSEKAMGWLRTF